MYLHFLSPTGLHVLRLSFTSQQHGYQLEDLMAQLVQRAPDILISSLASLPVIQPLLEHPQEHRSPPCPSHRWERKALLYIELPVAPYTSQPLEQKLA